jgi:hypothetical protein
MSVDPPADPNINMKARPFVRIRPEFGHNANASR